MELTIQHLSALAPLLITNLTIVVVMLTIAWNRNHLQTFMLSCAGLNLALLSIIQALKVAPLVVTKLMIIDNFALLYIALILIATIACIILAHAHIGEGSTGYPGNKEELYLLLLLAAAGGIVLVSSQHLAELLIGLELLSIPTYGLVTYAFFNKRSLEAGIKYMVLSTASSAFLLFGMALLYAEAGSLSFTGIGHAIAATKMPAPSAQLGLTIMLIGLSFKLSLVPFHLWTPDVYEGAPAPVAAFLATVSKVAVFAVMVRLFQISPAANTGVLSNVLTVIAIASILFGNLLALTQSNLKRLLSYSSIAHFGYLLIALVASKGLAVEAICVYLVTYVLNSLGAFGVITLMSAPFQDCDTDTLHTYRGLFWRRPYLTIVLTLIMLSLAGIPLTAGFIGKFYIVATGVEAHEWWLVTSLVLGNAISLFYYLRVMITLYMIGPSLRYVDTELHWEQKAGGVMLLAIAIFVFLLGVYPQPLLTIVRYTTLGA
ncbi:NADH-quinone oxidoreductase subunit NuoN [Candidatus Pseudomonas adelgestsugas]|nr:NADH-quinone oxidoreductase subunit NuoN [Candidatus Pseudomonas adelgestsugas]